MHLQTVWLFIITFLCFSVFLGGRVWLTSPLPFPLSSFPLLFLFSDRSAPLINGALSHFLPDTFFFLRVLFWPPSISFFTGQIDLCKERDWLLFVCSFVPPHCVLKGLTHTRQNQSIALSFSKRPITWSKHDVVHAGIWSVARKRVIKLITADP